MTPDDDLPARPDGDSGEPGDDATAALIRRHATRHRASPALHARVRAEIALLDAAGERPGAAGRGRAARMSTLRTLALGFGAGMLATAVVVLALLPREGPSAQDELAAQLVSAHVRALMASHLTDVAASDQHVVKPWFQGKLAYAPPVEDFAAEGYPLVGGRLDVIDGHAVAALVYQRHQHVINLLVWPAAAPAPASATLRDAQGWHLLQWADGSMRYAAVSDLNPAELQAFERLWAARR